MRNLHRVLALLASLIILCTVMPLGALFMANADGENVVINGGFENGKDNWTFNSGTADIVTDAHEGGSALQLSNPNAWAEGAIQTVPAESNADYKIVWYSKRVSGTGAFNMCVMNTADWTNLKSVSGQNWMNETSGNWVKNEYTVNTGSATSVLIKFSAEVNNPGTILLDEITMIKVGGGIPDVPVTPSSNLLQNGDFETGDITGWNNLWGSNEVSIVDGRNGGSAMHVVSGQWKHVRQELTVEPNTDYIITGWYKDVTDMTLLIKDGGDSVNVKQQAMSGGSNWTKVTLEINSGSYTALIVSLMGNVAESKGTFDDFAMVKVGGDEPVDPPVEPGEPAVNMLENSDFETGDTTGWENVWDKNTVSIVDGREGGKALNVLSGQWQIVRQKVAVEPNTDYVVRAWGKDVYEMTLLVKDSADSTNMAQKMFVNGDAWKEVTVEFNSGDNAEVFIGMMGNGEGSKGTFDDFSMTKKAGSTPGASSAVVNGDFETGSADGWTVYGGTAVSADAKRGGNYGLHLLGDGGWGGLAFQNVTVEPGKEYTVTLWVKAVANGVNIQFKDGGTSGTQLEGKWVNATTWTPVVVTLTPTTDTLCINFCGSGSGVAEDAYLDDVTVVEKTGIEPDPDVPVDPDEPVEPDTPAGVINGDFEKGEEGWNIHQTTAMTADAAHGGAMGAHLKGAGGWGGLLDQIVPSEFAQDYVLTFWIKVNANGVNFQIKNKDSEGAVLVGDWIDTNKAGVWTKMTYEFTAENSSTLINFCGSGNGAAEDAYVDDIVLTAKKPIEPGAGVINGDFENGDEGWTLNESFASIVDTAHGGSKALQVSNPSAWSEAALQVVYGDANTDYTITWYSKRVEGAGPFNFIVMDGSDKNLKVVSGQNWMNETSGNWVKNEVIVSTGADGVIKIKLTSEAANAGIILIDDIVVAKPGEDPNAGKIVNGDFEKGAEGWTLNESFASIVDTAHGGSKALQISNPSAWGEAALQTVPAVPNTKYVITWYSKRVEGNGPFNFILMDGSDKNLTVDGQNWMNETSGDWVENQVIATTGADGKIKIKITSEAAGSGILLIDDIVIAKEGVDPDNPDGPVDPAANLVKNGDFSNGTDGWTWNGNTKLDPESGYISGKPSALLDHDKEYGEALTQTVKVEKNTDYVVIFYTKRISGHGAWDLFLMDADTINNGNVNVTTTGGERWFNQTVEAGWVKTRLLFNSGDMTNIYFKFGPEAADSGVFLLDDVGMYRKEYEPSEPDEPVVPESGMTLTSNGVVNNRPITADKNILQNGNFESTGGQWDVDTFHTDLVSVVEDKTTMFGSKSLYFNTSALAEADAVKNIFWLELQPDTSYVFSVWVKGARLADDNLGRNTIGVVDANGQFLLNREILFLDGTRQIVPTAWDDQWHLRSVEFNTGSNTTVGIALAGWGSKMWVDDMALFVVGDGTKYVSENMGGGVKLSYDFDQIACEDEDTLIPDPNMNTADASGFWADSYGWRNGFISFVDNEYEYGASMKYTSTRDAAATYIIKWVDVEPETQYTFAVDIKILEDGFGRIGLLDNKKRDKVEFFSVSFDSYDYDDYENTGWRTVVASFNTDVYDRIGIAFIDDGGEVLIDNMRIFKNADGKNVVDDYVEPPAPPAPPATDEPVVDEPVVDEPVIEDEPVVEDEPVIEDDFGYDDDFGYENEEPMEEEPIIEEEPQEEPQQEEEVIIKRRKKVKKAPTGVDPMVWVWVGSGSAVALAGAAVAAGFIFKRPKFMALAQKIAAIFAKK